MRCSISDLRNKQVVCVKDGCIIGFVSDVEINTTDGVLTSLIIYGRPKFFGIFGREDDITIPWREIEVIGQETILVSTEPSSFVKYGKKSGFFRNAD